MKGVTPGTGKTSKTCKLEDCVITIICMDEPSRNWLQKTVGEMNPRNNMIVKVGEVTELIRTSRVTMKLPKLYNGLRK
jgi:hypothetical protein